MDAHTIPLTEAVRLAREWDALTGHWDKAADRHAADKDFREAAMAHAKAETYEMCAKQLRRIIAAEQRRCELLPEPHHGEDYEDPSHVGRI